MSSPLASPPLPPVAAPTADASAPLVSVVIAVSGERRDCLRRMLASLDRQTYPNRELILVDNGTQPPLAPEARAAALIRNDTNLGISHARNQGIARARGELVVCFDDDSELNDPRTVAEAVRFIAAFPNAAALGLAQTTAEGQLREDQPSPAEHACYTDKFYGCGCALRRRAVLEVGGFNGLYNYYYEENELCLRLIDAGYDIVFAPHIRVIHHRDLRGRDWNRIHRLLTRNLLICAVQRYPWWIVPASFAHTLAHFLRRARQRCGGDWPGAWWALRDLARLAKPVLAGRAPVRLRSVLKSWRLRRGGGVRIDDAPTLAAEPAPPPP